MEKNQFGGYFIRLGEGNFDLGWSASRSRSGLLETGPVRLALARLHALPLEPAPAWARSRSRSAATLFARTFPEGRSRDDLKSAYGRALVRSFDQFFSFLRKRLNPLTATTSP